MKAYALDQFGLGLAGLVRRDKPMPEPGPGQVLIKVRARSINYRDLLILSGHYPVPAHTGVTPLSDGAGEVAAVGKGVDTLVVGDRVVTVYFPRWQDGPFSMTYALEQYGCTRDGVLAEYVLADELGVIAVPEHLSFEEAATLPCAAVTAWAALDGSKPVLAGETVMAIGTGGVALFALQFAKSFGARTIAVTTAPEKSERLAAMGVDEVVVRGEDPSWAKSVREATEGRGVDHLVETGSLDTVATSLSCVRENGLATIVAALGQGAVDTSVFSMPITIRRTYVGSRIHAKAMNSVITKQKLRPIIDTIVAFDDVQTAFERLQSRNAFGKILIADEI